jgi:hypothetical protein
MSASAMKELNFIQLKDVYATSGAATSGCFGPNLPQTKVECIQKLYAHLFYNRGDRSVELLDLLPDCRVGDQVSASCEVEAPLLRGRTIVASAEDVSQAAKKRRVVSAAKCGTGASATQLFTLSPPLPPSARSLNMTRWTV